MSEKITTSTNVLAYQNWKIRSIYIKEYTKQRTLLGICSHLKQFCVVGLNKLGNELIFWGAAFLNSYTVDYNTHYSLRIPAEHNENEGKDNLKNEMFPSIKWYQASFERGMRSNHCIV